MNLKAGVFLISISFINLLNGMDGKALTLILPVNHMVPSEHWVSLEVTVPAIFKAAGPAAAPVAEFIPITDSDPYKWSEQITTHFLKGAKKQARDFLKDMRTVFCNSSNGRVIEASSQEDAHYSLRILAMVYEFRNRKEFVYMQYVSGPADCAGVQYALPLSASRDEAQALAQAEKFMKNNVKLIIGLKQP